MCMAGQKCRVGTSAGRGKSVGWDTSVGWGPTLVAHTTLLRRPTLLPHPTLYPTLHFCPALHLYPASHFYFFVPRHGWSGWNDTGGQAEMIREVRLKWKTQPCELIPIVLYLIFRSSCVSALNYEYKYFDSFGCHKGTVLMFWVGRSVCVYMSVSVSVLMSMFMSLPLSVSVWMRQYVSRDLQKS